MAVGVARSAEAVVRAAVAATLLTVCGFALSPAAAADTTEPDGSGPKLSPVCEAPASDIATPAPLPHLAAKLRPGATIRVLAIGSSSTVGLGASSPGQNYPSQLEAILEATFKGLNVVIVNRGVSGEVASATSDRLRTLVALEKPDLVLWQVGTNDALMNVPVGEFVDTVRDTVDWLKEHQIDTVLVGLQYTLQVSKEPHYAEIRAALRELATAENVLLVRRYEAMEFIEKARSTPLVSADGVHLNDLGYRCMAEHIARAMVVSAFLRPPRRPT